MIKNLILSSGGVNGYFFVGGFKYLIENNLLNNLENILGTSAGSIFGFLYLLDFKIDEIIELVTKMEPNHLLNITGESILSFFDTYGFDSGEKFIKILRIICKRKLNNPNITFKELYQLTNITFNVAALNVSKRKMVYFSHTSNPDMEVVMAIRMSASIPILFKPINYESNFYTDGGALDPCSLDFFKNSRETLALMICVRKNKSINNFKEYLLQIFSSPIEKVVEDYYDKPNIIIYQSKDNEGLNFEIKSEKIMELINLGYDITKEELPDILDYFRHKPH